jgi:copper chaperone
MEQMIEVENIKCGGCANTIKKKLEERYSPESSEIDIEQGRITLTTDEAVNMDELEETLRGIGYPKRGSVEGLDNVKAKAVSFVSCAIGRME